MLVCTTPSVALARHRYPLEISWLILEVASSPHGGFRVSCPSRGLSGASGIAVVLGNLSSYVLYPPSAINSRHFCRVLPDVAYKAEPTATPAICASSSGQGQGYIIPSTHIMRSNTFLSRVGSLQPLVILKSILMVTKVVSPFVKLDNQFVSEVALHTLHLPPSATEADHKHKP